MVVQCLQLNTDVRRAGTLETCDGDGWCRRFKAIHEGGHVTRNLLLVLGAFLFGAGSMHNAAQQAQVKGGYVIEHDAEVAFFY